MSVALMIRLAYSIGDNLSPAKSISTGGPKPDPKMRPTY
jgi:hypothetical protein